jgi:hypothetical protein
MGGTYHKVISVQSNDPSTPTVNVPVTLSVTGASNLVTSATSITFDVTFVNNTTKKVLTIGNNGTDMLSITNLSFDPSVFSSPVTDTLLAPGKEMDLQISFSPTTLGMQMGALVITSNDPDGPITTIALQGLSVAPPIISATPASLSSFLYTGEEETQLLTIENTGGSELTFTAQIDFIGPTTQAQLIIPQNSNQPNNNGVITAGYPDTTYPLAVGDFTPLANSFFPLTCMTVNPLSNLIYAQRNSGNEFYSYNVITDTWTTLQPSPVNSGNNGGAAYLNGEIYTSATNHNTIGIYSIVNNSWTTITAPIATGNLTSDGDYLYAVGGTQFTKYDPSSGVWSPLPSPPFGFSQWGGLVYLEGFIYGHQGNGSSGFAKFSLASQTWTTLPSLPNGGVLGAAIDPFGKTYYAYGSYQGNNLYAFDLASQVWHVTSIPLFNVDDGGIAYASDGHSSGMYFLQGEIGVGFGKFETAGLNWLTINPTSDTIANGSSTSITAKFDAFGMVGGTYHATIKILNNDPQTPSLSVPVTLTVTGAPDIELDKQDVNFGDVFLGQTKPMALKISNTGTDILAISDMVFDSPVFSTSAVLPVEIAPGTFASINVHFTPAASAPVTGQLSITSNDPDVPSFLVTLNGTGVEPPIIEVTPTTIDETLHSGEEIVQTLTIKNKGTSKLMYSTEITYLTEPTALNVQSRRLNSYTINTADPDGGHTNNSNVEGLDLSLSDLSGTQVGYWMESPPSILIGDIASRGGTSVALTRPISSSMLNPLQVVLIDDAITSLTGSEVNSLRDWANEGGSLVIMADNSSSMSNVNVLLSGTGISETSVSFVSALLTNIVSHAITTGVTQVRADSYGGYLTVTSPAQTLVFDDLTRPHLAVSVLGRGKFVAVGNELMGDFQIGAAHDRKLSNQIIDWLAASNAWISTPVAGGELLAGQSVDLEVKLSANNLVEGMYTAHIKVNSNDPAHNSILVPVSLQVIGVPIIQVTPSALNFGTLFTGTSQEQTVVVSNKGTKSLSISSIELSNTVYSHDGVSTVIAPAASYTFKVKTLPIAAGIYVDSLRVHSNDSNHPTSTVYVTTTALDPPVFDINSSGITKTLPSDALGSETVIVTNSGGSPLLYNTEIQYITTTSLTGERLKPEQSNYPNNQGQIQITTDPVEFPLAPGDFSQRANSPAVLTCMAIDPTSNIIYAQQNGGTSFYAYNPSTNLWMTKQPCPLPSGNNGGAVYLNGNIYTLYTGFNYLGIYSIATNSWTVVTSPINTGNITSDGTYLYAVNGNLFMRYDPVGASWTNLTAPPFFFTAWGALAFHDGVIYGHQGDGQTAFAKYSIATQTWTLLPSVPSGAVLGGAIDPATKTYYAYGSYGGNNFYSYDIKNALWSLSRVPFFSVSDGGLVYMSGDGAKRGIYFLQGEYGTGLGRYETQPGLQWLSVSPSSDTLAAGVSRDLVFNFDSNTLPDGMYTANVIFKTNAPSNPTVTLPVNLLVDGPTNRPPSVVKAIGDEYLRVGFSLIIKLDSIFNDADGDALTYLVNSSNPLEVGVSLSGDLLTVHAAAVGEVIITISAKDVYSAQISTTFKVKAYTNSPPVVTIPISDQTVRIDKTLEINLAQIFSDPDGQALTYEAYSSATHVASLELLGSVIRLSPHALGTSTIDLKSIDPFGEFVSSQFVLRVIPKNEAPVISKSLQPVELLIMDEKKDSVSFDLGNFFSDPNSDPLTYVVSVSNESAIHHKVTGSRLTLSAQQPGSAQVTVVAKDPDDLWTAQLFNANVALVTGVETDFNQPSLTIAPNPASTLFSIQYYLPQSGTIGLAIHDSQGRRIDTLVSGDQKSGEHHIDYSGHDMVSGIYTVLLYTNSNVLVQRLVIVK